MIHEISLRTRKKFELLDITKKVENIVKMGNGSICIVYTPHATAAIVINEGWDPDIAKDFLNVLDRIVPLHANYLHDRIDGNAAAHIKATILGPSEIIPVENKQLILGKWQNIFFVELDGPRANRKVYVKLV